MASFPGFKLDCLTMDQILQELPEPPTWSIVGKKHALFDIASRQTTPGHR